jgi:hypothetical protein
VPSDSSSSAAAAVRGIQDQQRKHSSTRLSSCARAAALYWELQGSCKESAARTAWELAGQMRPAVAHCCSAGAAAGWRCSCGSGASGGSSKHGVRGSSFFYAGPAAAAGATAQTVLMAAATLDAGAAAEWRDSNGLVKLLAVLSSNCTASFWGLQAAKTPAAAATAAAGTTWGTLGNEPRSAEDDSLAGMAWGT